MGLLLGIEASSLSILCTTFIVGSFASLNKISIPLTKELPESKVTVQALNSFNIPSLENDEGENLNADGKNAG